MSKLLANRTSAVVAAALFVAASWFSASSELQATPGTLVVSQPAAELQTVASNR